MTMGKTSVTGGLSGQNNQIANKKPNTIKSLMSNPKVMEKFNEVLGEKSTGFVTSVVNVVNNNSYLAKAEPNSVLSSAMVAATLNLPIDPNLGFAAIVPYGNKAQFQMMYRGYVQLAIRSGQYKTMNVSEVYEDEFEFYNPLTGEIEFTDIDGWEARYKGDNSKVVGYFANFKLINGFEKNLYMSKKQVEIHGRTYSKSFNQASGRWKKDFDAMAKKTVLKMLLSKWGVLSVDMQTAVEMDQAVVKQGNDGSLMPEYVDAGETEQITGDVNGAADVEYTELSDEEKAEIEGAEKSGKKPDFVEE